MERKDEQAEKLTSWRLLRQKDLQVEQGAEGPACKYLRPAGEALAKPADWPRTFVRAGSASRRDKSARFNGGFCLRSIHLAQVFTCVG
jgi:hypothetical protein